MSLKNFQPKHITLSNLLSFPVVGMIAVILVGIPKDVMAETQSSLSAEQSAQLREVKQLIERADKLREGDNYKGAIPLLEKALRIQEKVLGKEHLDVGITLYNLAQMYDDWRAEPLYLRSLAIIEKVMGKENRIVANILRDLAFINDSVGRYARSESFLLSSLVIEEKILGKEDPYFILRTLDDLGGLYIASGRYTEAESLYLRSLAIKEKARNRGGIPYTLDMLGLIYNLQGRYTKAESTLLRSLAIQEKEKETGKETDMAATLYQLSVVYKSQGNYVKAESFLLRCLSISDGYFGKVNPPIASKLNYFATLYWAQEKISKTTNFLSRGLSIEEKMLQAIYRVFSERWKQEMLQNYFTESTNITISLALQQAAKNPTIAKLAINTVFRRKGRVLDAMTNIVETLRSQLESNPKIKKLFDKYLDVQQQLAKLAYSEQQKQKIDKINRLQAQKEELENELSFASKDFRKEIQPIELAPTQAKIPQDAALVEIIQYKPFNPKAQYHKRFDKPRYAAVVLHQSGEPKWVDLGDAETIDKSVKNLLKLLTIAPFRANKSDKDRGTIKVEPVDAKKRKLKLQEAARTLDKQIMAPIRPLLGDARHLLLSPDGQLNLIPFEALKDENNQYLVESYSFSYLTTGRDLLRLDIQAKQLSNPVVFADIDYNNYENVIIAKNTSLTNSSSKNQRSVDLTNLSYGSLPGASLEGRAIQNIFPNTRLITGKKATETSVKQLKAPRILHLATHGFFLENQKNNNQSKSSGFENPLLRSGLALAGFNNRHNKQNNSEDGVLTALEVSGLNLRGTKLVVLSACETGLGEVKNGDGVYGLRRALVIAGSQSQLLSLWKVSDDGTKDLMVEYYNNLKAGKGRHESLREVQLEFIRDSKYNHPYYWASFIPAGNWRNMQSQ